MELTYSKCGDYLVPDLVLSDTKEYHIGKYGRLRRAYLKEHRPILYTDLIVTEKLFLHLEEIDIACRERLEIIEKSMMQQEGVTEALKAADQMAWVRSMTNIMLPQDVVRSPIDKPIITDPIPEKIPFSKTICKGSLEEIFRVQLFSNPQQTAARSTNNEP